MEKGEFAVYFDWLARSNTTSEKCIDQKARDILRGNALLEVHLQSGDINEFFTKCFFNMQGLQSINFAGDTSYEQGSMRISKKLAFQLFDIFLYSFQS